MPSISLIRSIRNFQGKKKVSWTTHAVTRYRSYLKLTQIISCIWELICFANRCPEDRVQAMIYKWYLIIAKTIYANTCPKGISSLVPKGRDLYPEEPDSCPCSLLRGKILQHHTAVLRRRNSLYMGTQEILKPWVYISPGSTGQLFPTPGWPFLTRMSWAYWVMAVQIRAFPFLSLLNLSQNQAGMLWWWREKLIHSLSSSLLFQT